MKKLLGILVLGLLLTSCSEYMSRQKIENCADTEYSKDMAHPIQVYFYTTDKGHSNEFEETMLRMKYFEAPIDMIADYINDLLSEKEISEDESRRGISKIQSSTNDAIKEIEIISQEKEKEVMDV